MNASKAIKKYLRQYAETEAEEATRFADELKENGVTFEQAICLPCFSESIDHLHQLLGFLVKEINCLAIVVLNQPDNLSPAKNSDSLAQNALWQSAIENTQRANPLMLFEGAGIKLLRVDENYIMVVDRFSQRTIPSDQGVGLARKIGSDIALALFDRGLLQTRWLHSSDADCILPPDYFARSAHGHEENEVAALVYPFQHIDSSGNSVSLHHSNPIVQATALYERKLHQYVDGLTFARSSYNHHSIGSCICVSLPHYAMCRGFPPLSAGEDFYLLNKIRKLGQIKTLDSSPIRIRARQSNRTPFGTGAAITDILSTDEPLQAKIFYPHSLFVALRFFLIWMETLGDDHCAASDFAWGKSLLYFWHTIEQESEPQTNIAAHSTKLPPAGAILRATESVNFERAIRHCIAQTRSKKAFSQQLFLWFDGFRTLRWLHNLRDESGMAMVSIEATQNTKK